MSHASRAAMGAREPALVTMKVRAEIGRLRGRRVVARILPAIVAASARRIRIVQFSIQHDHLHLLVEADSAAALSRGVQGLAVRLARQIHLLLSRCGPVFADRFHARVLRTPREVRNALAYVLGNARKHGERIPSRTVDPCSSAASFDGWDGPVRTSRHWLARSAARSPAAAQSWLLRKGWRRAGGALDPDHRPGPV